MAAWWQSLSAEAQVYYLIAIASSVLLFIQMVLNLFGLLGHDVDVGGGGAPDAGGGDVDMSAEHPDLAAHSTGLAVLSVRTIMAFLVGFGWMGAILAGQGSSTGVTLVAATAVGLVFLFTVFFIMRALYQLADSGNIDYANAVGRTASVYLRIPAKGQGMGQVQVVVQGRLRELQAVTDDEQELPTGALARVVGRIGETTMKVTKEEAKP